MSQVWALCNLQVLGGLPDEVPDGPEIPTVQGHELLGGPQMLQLRCTTVMMLFVLLVFCISLFALALVPRGQMRLWGGYCEHQLTVDNKSPIYSPYAECLINMQVLYCICCG